jgi:hypothetical protein
MLCRGCNCREGLDGSAIYFRVSGEHILEAYRANPPAVRAGWIWDGYGLAGKIMSARAKAAGKNGFSVFADADLLHYVVIGQGTLF